MGTKFTSQTITGFNSSPPSDDGQQIATNEIKWSNHIDKIGTPLKNYIDAIQTALVTHTDESVVDKAAIYTIEAGDHKQTINQTVGSTITLNDAATMGAGFIVTIKNSHSAAITIARTTGTDTIDGTAADDSLDAGEVKTYLVNSSTNGYIVIAGQGEAHTVLPDTVSQAEAEAGTATTTRLWTAERVKQAIDALSAQAVSSGSYTATVTPGSGTITLETTLDTLHWYKIGKLVHIQGRLQVASVSTPSGTLLLTSLPFAVMTGTDSTSTRVPIVVENLSAPLSGPAFIILTEGSTSVNMQQSDGDTTSTFTTSVAFTTVFNINLHYLTD